MTFNEGANLDTSQVVGGGKAGAVVGGGIGGLLLLLLVMFLGGNPLSGGTASTYDLNQVMLGGTDGSDTSFAHCQTGADANEDVTCRIVGTVNSSQDYWTDALPQDVGREYREAKTVIYSGATQSPCGTASNATGPFYCPADERVYIDAAFFDELESQFGADGGNLAQMYVVAHEYGHHVQNVLGILAKGQDGKTGPLSGGVRVELMADCFAGVWANHAATTQDDAGNTLIEPLTANDIKSAMSAAAAVGDDHIQETLGGGRVNQDTWTHGSSQSRQRWFTTGYESGNLNSCNTFATNDL